MRGGADLGANIKLWDLPVRLIHWSFVLLLPALWWTHKTGDLDTHKLLGYVMLGLVVFRVLWGFVGSETARFASFLKGPGAVIAYLKGLGSKETRPVVGHNPLGGWSVIVLLALLALQTGLGLFAQDVDGIESGPLTYLVSYDTADAARELHEIVFNAILGFVGLHILAVLYYLLAKRDNLVRPMVTGRKRFIAAVSAPTLAPAWRILLCAVIAGALAWWISLGAPLPGVTT
jgi:cytochrome b